MKRTLIATAFAIFIFAGCDSSSTPNYVPPPQPVQPVQPVEPQPAIPTAGVGSIKADMDCNGGTITTKYTFGNVPQDQKSFVMQYRRNNDLEDLTYPSTYTNGSMTTVNDIYYIRPNDTAYPINWIVQITYQTAAETYTLVTTTIKQPACSQDDDNETALRTEYRVY